MTRTISQTADLSFMFSKILNEWLSKEEIKQINIINSTPEYKKSSMCATHEFCDPNEAMAEAFEMVYGRELNVTSDDDISIINKAWKESKSKQFKTK